MSIDDRDGDDPEKTSTVQVPTSKLLDPLAALVEALLKPIHGVAPDAEFEKFAAEVFAVRNLINGRQPGSATIPVSTREASRIAHFVATQTAEALLMLTENAGVPEMADATVSATILYAYAHTVAQEFTD